MRCQHTERQSAGIVAREEGIFVVLFALATVVLFSLIGLAIDGARLYSAELTAQNWADAAAYSAASRIALDANDFSSQGVRTIISEAIEAGERLARASIGFSLYDPNDVVIELSVPSLSPPPSPSDPTPPPPLAVGSPFVVTAQASITVPLFFMRVVPRVGSERTVAVRASSEIQPALGVIAIDSSGSMNCPSGGDCSCFPDCDPAAGTLRFQAVLDAVESGFLERFDRQRDQIGVMMYNKGTRTLVNINPSGGFSTTLDPALYEAAIQQFDVTNTTLAIINAFAMLKRPYLDGYTGPPAIPPRPDATPFIAMISDGAPTGTCFKPDSTNDNLFNGRVACFWEITWEGFFNPQVAADGTRPPELQKRGVSEIGIVNSYAAVPNNYQFTQPPFGTIPACSELSFSGWQSVNNAGPDDGAETELFACLNNFSFRTQDGTFYPLSPIAFETTERVSDPPFTPLGDTPLAVNAWRKLFYRTAIAEADEIRRKGVTFYTIGLGFEGGGDLYSSLPDTLARKDTFLRRIALPYGNSTSYAGLSPAATEIGDSASPKGEYYAIFNPPDEAQIAQQLRQIVRRVKMRMVQ